jgi:hypothetical protein
LCWDDEKLAVSHDEEKHLLCWDEEKLAFSYDEEKRLLSSDEEKHLASYSFLLLIHCDEKTHFFVPRLILFVMKII